MLADLVLSAAELVALTGYRTAPRQLAELKRQGFYRARQSPTTGRVILERAHFESVSSGAPKPKAPPKLHMVGT